jgi:general nucleoside transport system permease protein
MSIDIANLTRSPLAALRPLATSRVGIVILAFIVVGLFLMPFGINPLTVYGAMIFGSLGSLNAISETLIYAAPILLTSLSAILCFRAGIWNIGADGQLYLGAIATVWLGFNGLGLPALFVIPAMAIAAFLAGALWGMVPGFLKIRFGANEVIVTIMMNFLAVILATYLISGPWASGINPVTKPIVSQAYLPILIAGTRLHANLIVAVVAALFVYWLLNYSIFGYQVRAIGQNLRAARVAGMPVEKISLLSFILAGGVAGLAGLGEVAGIHHNLPDQLSAGFGYTGIAVALLADLNPLGAIVSALFLSALNVGANAMQRAIGVPVALVWVIQGFILLSLLASGAGKRR